MTDVLLPDALSTSPGCVTTVGFSMKVTLAPNALKHSASGMPSPRSSLMILDARPFFLDSGTGSSTGSSSVGKI